jgi:hypothetical protein
MNLRALPEVDDTFTLEQLAAEARNRIEHAITTTQPFPSFETAMKP